MSNVRRRLAAALTSTAVLTGVTVAATAVPAHADLTAPELRLAWSAQFASDGSLSSPVAADLDGDGRPEVLAGAHDGVLRGDRADGSLLWQRVVDPAGDGRGVAMDGAPTVADLDGDGRPEIVVPAGSLSVRNQSGGVVTFDAAGNVRWRWVGDDIFNMWDPGWGTRPDGYREGVVTTPAVGDVDGDGRPDVVIAAMDNQVHVLRADGSVLPGWVTVGHPARPTGFWVDDSLFSSPAVADVDGDGRAEVFVGVAATPGGPIDHAGGVFLALGYQGGRAVVRWQRFTGEVMNASPAIGDIDGDGRLEVVTGAGWDYARSTRTPDARSVFAWHADDGSPKAGFPVVTNGVTFSSPALGDLTGDGVPEIVIGTNPLPGAGTGDGRLYAIRGDGSVLWDVVLHRFVAQINTWEGGGGIVGSPTVADLNGDGVNDVAVPNPWATFTVNGRDGSRLWAPLHKGWTSENSPAVLSTAAGWRMVTFASNGTQSRLEAWALADPWTPPRSAWPQWRNRPEHTGVHAGADAQCPVAPAAAAGAAGGVASQVVAAAFRPLTPNRVLDTRTGNGSVRAALGARCVLPVTVAGRGGVPAAGVSAVTLNVTVTETRAAGFVTVYPCGTERPTASNLNYSPRQSVSNLVTVELGPGGQVCVYTWGQAHVVADVAGWFGEASAGSRFTPVTPARLTDTRAGGMPVLAGQVLEVPVAGRGGVPAAGVTGVSLNVTTAGSNGDGFLTVFPCGQARPDASNVNHRAGEVVPNHAMAPLGAAGSVCIYSHATSHVVVDVMGYWSPSGRVFRTTAPTRLADTRLGGAPVGAGQVLRVPVAGRAGVPAAGATAASLNVTAVDPDGAGFLTVYPCGATVPGSSSVNHVDRGTVANHVVVGLGDGGAVCVYSYRPSHVIVDLAGWFG